jgi:hypothetical protein
MGPPVPWSVQELGPAPASPIFGLDLISPNAAERAGGFSLSSGAAFGSKRTLHYEMPSLAVA